MDIKTQNEKILSWLQRGKKITSLDAFKRFQCLRLSGRIHDLRRMGHEIKSKMIDVPGGKRVAEYSL